MQHEERGVTKSSACLRNRCGGWVTLSSTCLLGGGHDIIEIHSDPPIPTMVPRSTYYTSLHSIFLWQCHPLDSTSKLETPYHLRNIDVQTQHMVVDCFTMKHIFYFNLSCKSQSCAQLPTIMIVPHMGKHIHLYVICKPMVSQFLIY